MGSRDGNKLREKKGPFSVHQRVAVAQAAAESHWRYLLAGRLTNSSIPEYGTAFLEAALQP